MDSPQPPRKSPASNLEVLTSVIFPNQNLQPAFCWAFCIGCLASARRFLWQKLASHQGAGARVCDPQQSARSKGAAVHRPTLRYPAETSASSLSIEWKEKDSATGFTVTIRQKVASAVAVASVTIASTSFAQTNALSLVEAQRLAFQKNWDLLAARSDVDLALAQSIVSREFPNPTAAFGVTKIRVDSHSASTSSGNGVWDRSYDTVVAVNQLIEIGGKRGARQASAQAGVKSAEGRLADARRLLERGVAQAYVAALIAERNREILTNSAASLRKEAELAEVRERAGDLSKADRSQIEIAAERLELDAAATAAAARNANIALETLLGRSHPSAEVQLTDALESLTNIPGELTNHSAAYVSRPDVVAAEHARTKAEADLRLQKAQRVPDPTLFAQYEHEPPDQPNTMGFGVSLPLPLWNWNKGNIASARASLDQATVAEEKVRAQAEADILSAQTSYVAALTRWQQYRDELVSKSSEVRESVAYAYRKGGASLIDLLSAERNENEVRLAAAQAAADVANAAASLKAATNTYTPTKKRL